jgi:hypothetical protein
MTLELPVGSRWIQLRGAAVAVTPDERVYLVRGGRAVELVSAVDPAALDELPDASVSRPVAQEGDGS